MCHWPAMIRACQPLLGSRSDAEDCASEALLAALQADAEQIRNTEAWLVTVAKRRAIDRLRTATRGRARQARLEARESFSVDGLAEAVADRQEAEWVAHVARRTLTPAALGVLEELAAGASIDDAASRLGLTRRSVESHLRRARVVIRAALASTLTVVGWLLGGARRSSPAAAPSVALAAAVLAVTLQGLVPEQSLTVPAPGPAVDAVAAPPRYMPPVVAPGPLPAPARSAAPPTTAAAALPQAPQRGGPGEVKAVTPAGETVVRRETRDGPSDPAGILLDCLGSFQVSAAKIGC